LWLPRWPEKALAIALMAFIGSWLFGQEAALAGAEEASPEDAGALDPARFSKDTSDRSVFMKAQGTWQDRPPVAMEPPAGASIPPLYRPYNTGSEYYGSGPWPGYVPQRDRDNPRPGSWLDSFCPWPERRSAWPERGRYPAPLEPPGQWGYPGVYGNQPPLGFIEPDGR